MYEHLAIAHMNKIAQTPIGYDPKTGKTAPEKLFLVRDTSTGNYYRTDSIPKHVKDRDTLVPVDASGLTNSQKIKVREDLRNAPATIRLAHNPDQMYNRMGPGQDVSVDPASVGYGSRERLLKDLHRLNMQAVAASTALRNKHNLYGVDAKKYRNIIDRARTMNAKVYGSDRAQDVQKYYGGLANNVGMRVGMDRGSFALGYGDVISKKPGVRAWDKDMSAPAGKAQAGAVYNTISSRIKAPTYSEAVKRSQPRSKGNDLREDRELWRFYNYDAPSRSSNAPMHKTRARNTLQSTRKLLDPLKEVRTEEDPEKLRYKNMFRNNAPKKYTISDLGDKINDSVSAADSGLNDSYKWLKGTIKPVYNGGGKGSTGANSTGVAAPFKGVTGANSTGVAAPFKWLKNTAVNLATAPYKSLKSTLDGIGPRRASSPSFSKPKSNDFKPGSDASNNQWNK